MLDRFCRKAVTPARALALLILPAVLQAIPQAARAAGKSEPLVTLSRPVAVPQALREAQPLGRLPAADRVQVALVLPWRNAEDLTAFVRRVNDPADPLYKHFLTKAQFQARYSPTAADYQALTAWAKANGLAVSQTAVGRKMLVVSGVRDTVEAAFHVQLNRFRLASGRVVYVNNAAPKVPQSVASRVTAVVGLNNYAQYKPFHKFLGRDTPLIARAQEVGSGPGGGLTPADIQSVYNIAPLATAGLDGTGQTVALYEQNGYDPKDIAAYVAAYGLSSDTTTQLQNITIGGYSGAVTDSSTQGEVTLDIELILAVAPKANILVYEFDDTSTDPSVGPLALMTKIADDDLAPVVSISYGGAEEDANFGGQLTPENDVYMQMNAQGQCAYASSGDTAAYLQVESDPTNPGAFAVSVSDPASQPYVVAVGGTSLKSAPTYTGESTWLNSGLPAPEGGGGGSSKFWAKPSYQAGVGASATMRDIPDVSLDADPETGYSIFMASSGPLSLGSLTGFTIIGGTSASCPLWAAFNLLVNQQRASFNLPNLGFANPDIYQIAESAKYAQDFHDIADGSTNGVFTAAVGYDDATGWGSYIADGLLPDLAPTAFGAGVVTVNVVDAGGNPVPGATVTLTTSQIPNFQQQTTTDAGGKDTFAVPTGVHNFNNTGQDATLTYTVVADATGQAGESKSGVLPGDTVTLHLSAPDHTYPGGSLQMISSPYDYSTVADFDTLFGTTSSNFYAWSPTSDAYLNYPTAPADTLRIGQGYWAALPTNAYVRRHGMAAPTTQAFRINLLPGWNMIGDPFVGAVPVSGIQVGGIQVAGGTASATVGIGSATTVVLPLYTYSPTAAAYQQLGVGDTLQPYLGYWIYAKQAAQLVIPVP